MKKLLCAFVFLMAPIARAETTDAGVIEPSKLVAACEEIRDNVSKTASLHVTAGYLERGSADRIALLQKTAENGAKINALYRQCVARLGAGTLIADVAKSESVIRSLTTMLDSETKCRATPQCMIDRANRDRVALATRQMCELVSSRADVVQMMARERANPSGVVNLNTLHMLGARIQEIDDEINESKPGFAALAGHPFSSSVCP